MAAIGFDVYGTLVDPLAMSAALEPHAGERASEMAALWRAKQLEYSFRRALMGAYENFDVCTRDSLRYAARAMGIELNTAEKGALLGEYLNLNAYPDVIPGIRALRARGHALVAFSNGVEATLQELLGRAGVLEQLDGIISVDDIRTFKPSPAVYRHLAERLDRPRDETWLVSSNYWDVTGALHAGLHAAWVRRNPDAIPDPWGPEPDLVVADLSELAGALIERT
jgi:2-haloacid dehalogenase